MATDDHETKLEELSLFLGAILIIFLQFGFSMLQIGGVQYRRSRKMFIKSLFDMSLTGLGKVPPLPLLYIFKVGG
jgi:membrane-anchored glycerophosphoryl diester phosphodiesterase (GDPDase)